MKWLFLPLFCLLYNSTHGQPRPTAYSMLFQQDPALRKWSSSIPNFKPDAFVYQETSDFGQHSPDTLRGTAVATYFNTFGKLIGFSPDKKQWLDFFSYQTSLEKIPGGRYRAYHDIDQALILGNTATGIRTGIAYMGASSWVEETRWLDNHTFIAVGVTSVTKGLQPFIYMGDTHTRKLYHYRPANDRHNRDRDRKYVSYQWAKIASRIIEE
ncbi:hypothetical protein [Chitinophaga varians]|uniref:hypothetical protein n=1 Tax=Chitinophaga varians TaxID=2202339 RepID=UPI00165F4B17|nr:hypothetical protein [Chitinophaga varians]MBC9909667.1 hypothetical protein [Chitinophaga varians]